MKRYQQFMDGVAASDTLHRRLAELKEPEKRPMSWKKYASAAAALALVVGVGAYGLGQGGWDGLTANFRDDSNPEIADVDKPDIATAEPGDVTEPAKRTLGGYDVTGGGMTAHYVLPYIEYGDTRLGEVSQFAADWDIPGDAVRRDLTGEEIAALLGGEDAVSTHLDWDGYQLTGWAAWYEGGSFWGAYIQGYAGPLDHFEFAVTAGQLPPTCIAYPSSVEQEVNGITVTADGHDSTATPSGGVDASTRRVSFMKGDYGYRFDLTGTSRALTEERVSRLVRLIADQGITPLGQAGSYTCPDCGVYIEAGVQHDHTQDGSPRDRGENWCGTPGADTEAYPSYNAFLACRTCGGDVPDRTEHHCKPDPAGGYVCGICGEAFPEGKVHSHELCVLPPAPTPGIYTCEVCGQDIPTGMEHSHQENHR